MPDDRWVWEYAFQPRTRSADPKPVRDEVKAVADRIVELATWCRPAQARWPRFWHGSR